MQGREGDEQDGKRDKVYCKGSGRYLNGVERV